MKLRRLLSGALALLLALTLLPGGLLCPQEALAAQSGSDFLHAKLISTGYIPGYGHYIVYEYLGDRLTSDKTSSVTNLAAWKRMSDADRMKVTKWFAGWNRDQTEQFGTTGKAQMDDWAMRKTGWKQAGQQLRANLMQKNYPELYAYYGDPDNPTTHALDYSEYDTQSFGEFSAKEKAELDVMLNRYGVAVSTGVDAYRKLANLKQAQTNVAVTFISSELIKIIMDNALSGRPSGELDDLKDKIWDVVDDQLKITDTIKEKTGLRYLSKEDVIDDLTGESDRIEGDAAISAIQQLEKLMAAQQCLAEEMMNFCKLESNTLRTKYGKLRSDDSDRRTLAAQQKSEYEAAIEAAKTAGAVLSELYKNGPSQSELNENCPRDSYGSDDAWKAAQRQYAQSWAQDKLRSAGESAANLVSGYTTSSSDGSQWNTAWETFTMPYLNLGDAFKKSGYVAKRDAVYGQFDTELARLRTAKTQVQTYISAWRSNSDALKSALKPHQTIAFTMTHGLTQSYGPWKLAETNYSDFVSQYFDQPFETIENNIFKGEDQLRLINAHIEELTAGKAEYAASVETFETYLAKVNAIYKATEEDLEYAMPLLRQAVDGLFALRERYPEWLAEYSNIYYQIQNRDASHAMLPLRAGSKLSSFWFGGDLNTDLSKHEASLQNLYNAVKDYPEDEAEYIGEICRLTLMIDTARSQRDSIDGESNHLTGTELDNLYALFGGRYKRYSDLYDEYQLLDDSSGTVKMYYDSYGSGLREQYSVRARVSQCLQYRGFSDTPNTMVKVLVNDLEGKSLYLDNMRTLYEQLLAERAALMEKAASASESVKQQAYERLRYYELKGDRYATRTPNYTYYLNSTASIAEEAYRRTYNFAVVDEFYASHITPVLTGIWAVYNGDSGYNKVTGLAGGGVTLMASVNAALQSGGRAKLPATVKTANSKPATIPDVLWKSSDQDVVTVDETGTITALAPGSATITATALGSPDLVLLADQNGELTGEYSGGYTVAYDINVSSDGIASVADMDTDYKLAGPTAKLSGGKLQFHAVLLYNGIFAGDEESWADPPQLSVLISFYNKNGRFLGCGTDSLMLAKGHGSELNAEIPLSALPAGGVTVKILLLDASLTPLSGYEPLVWRYAG